MNMIEQFGQHETEEELSKLVKGQPIVVCTPSKDGTPKPYFVAKFDSLKDSKVLVKYTILVDLVQEKVMLLNSKDFFETIPYSYNPTKGSEVEIHVLNPDSLHFEKVVGTLIEYKQNEMISLELEHEFLVGELSITI